MKARLATGVAGTVAGLGKMDVLIIPRKNGKSLAVHITRIYRIWIADDELDGHPDPESLLEEIEIPEQLVEEIESSFELKGGDLNQNVKNHLLELIKSIDSR